MSKKNPPPDLYIGTVAGAALANLEQPHGQCRVGGHGGTSVDPATEDVVDHDEKGIKSVH